MGVIPAKAGTHDLNGLKNDGAASLALAPRCSWVPAFAGMTPIFHDIDRRMSAVHASR
jgi:hypothetical protein